MAVDQIPRMVKILTRKISQLVGIGFKHKNILDQSGSWIR